MLIAEKTRVKLREWPPNADSGGRGNGSTPDKKIDQICFLISQTNEINQDSSASTRKPEAPSRLHWLSNRTRERIIDMSPSYINSMLRGRGTITGKAARKMENRLRLDPAGSMTIRTAEDRCAQREQIIQLLNREVGLISIARKVGCGVSAVQRVQRETRC